MFLLSATRLLLRRRTTLFFVLLLAIALSFAPNDAFGEGFAAPFSTIPMYNSADGVIVQDWDGDGCVDVSIACGADSRISTLKSNGHGGFGARSDFVGALSGARKIAAGDVQGDGTPDMVVAQYTGNSVRVYLMTPGAIAYTSFDDFATGGNPVDVSVGDLDADGDQDIVTANQSASTVSVLLGNGNGTFAPHTDYANGSYPSSLALGDLNSDGYLDAVTGSFYSGTVTVWYGSASGTLSGWTDIVVGANGGVRDVVLAKLDGDSDLDLAVLQFQGLEVFLGDGAGGFPSKADEGSCGGYALIAADFNGDGKLDLANGCSLSGGGLVRLGTGTGTFGPVKVFQSGGQSAVGIASGDLNGDGSADLAIASDPRNVSILHGNGDGTFGEDLFFASGSVIRKLSLAELTGDSQNDVFIATGEGIEIHKGLGTGNFTFTDLGYVPSGALDAVAVDFDNDGDRDFASVDGSIAPGNLTVFLNQGNGTLSLALVNSVSGTPSAIASADFDHDSILDLATASRTGYVTVLEGLGNGSFSELGSVPGAYGDLTAIAVGDLNADTHPDIVVADSASSGVIVSFGDGSGGFPASTGYSTGAGPVSIAVFDLDLDGDLDLAAACPGGDSIAVGLNDGTGSFLPFASYWSPGRPVAVVAGHADQGGIPDLFLLDHDDWTVSILRGIGSGTFAFDNQAWGVGAEAAALAVGDVTGDGRSDILASGLHGTGDGPSVQVLLNDISPPPDAAPVVTAPLSVNVEAGGSISLTVTAHDPNCDAISSLTAGGLPPAAAFTPNGANTAGTLTWNPTPAQIGDYVVTFTASNLLSGSKSTQVHAKPPGTDAAGTFVWTPKAGDAGTYQVCFIATNSDGDPPDTACTTVTVSSGGGGAAPFLSLLRATEAPSAPTKGPVVSVRSTASVAIGETLVIDVSATDTDGLTVDTSGLPAGNEASFTADQSPVVTAPSQVSATPGVPLTINVAVIDPDGDGITSLTASYPGLPPGNNASFTPNGTNTLGTFSWTPAIGDSGSYGVTFYAGNLLVGVAPSLVRVGTGLAGYWRLNGDGNDLAGGTNLTQAIGPTQFGPGYLNQALEVGPYSINTWALFAPAATDHGLPYGEPWTVECWVNASQSGFGPHGIVGAWDASASSRWSLWVSVYDGGLAHFDTYSSLMTNGVYLNSSVSVTDGSWHHLAVTSDGSNVTLYVDGAPHGSGTLDGPAPVVPGTLCVGCALNTYDLEGSVDEVRLWRRQRSQDEILAAMNGELGGYVTGVGPSPPIYRNALLQNRPNPFNPRTEIAFELEREGQATLRVFDVAGRLVRTLIDARLPAGRHEVTWDGRGDRGEKAASGAYFYRLRASGFEKTKRMLLLK